MAVTPALEATSLYRFFHTGEEEVLALRGVTLSVAPGEVVAVVGPSGSGKSTLLACCAGLDEPDGGHVRVAGDRLTGRPERERAAVRARRVGVVYQSDNLFGHLSVDANLRLAQRLGGCDDASRRRQLLSQLGLDEVAASLPAQLSGGEAVRAALAVALVNDPDVLLADEPTGELDAGSEQRTLELFIGHVERGAGALIATHSRAVAAIADRVIELVDGGIAG
jgi:putative ABC transport system ATP-binding protein